MTQEQFVLLVDNLCKVNHARQHHLAPGTDMEYVIAVDNLVNCILSLVLTREGKDVLMNWVMSENPIKARTLIDEEEMIVEDAWTLYRLFNKWGYLVSTPEIDTLFKKCSFIISSLVDNTKKLNSLLDVNKRRV